MKKSNQFIEVAVIATILGDNFTDKLLEKVKQKGAGYFFPDKPPPARGGTPAWPRGCRPRPGAARVKKRRCPGSRRPARRRCR